MANIAVELFGLKFKTPIIPAAGPNVGTGTHCWKAAEGGAGGILCKTVSSKAAKVPRPDMYKFDRLGMLNTELWTELSLEQWLNIEYDMALEAGRRFNIPVLASMGYTPEDLKFIGPKLEAKGVQGIEFTIHYLDPKRIVETAKALRESVSIPIIAKFSPHSGDLGDLAETIEPYVDGFACINSIGPTLLIDIEHCEPVMGSQFGYGWLSGPPIKPIALRCVFEVARRVKKPVIGIGGIASGKDVIEFFMAGASLVEICTVVMYKGQKIFGKIANEVSQWLDKRGFKDIKDIQGMYVRKYGKGQRVVTEFEESPKVDADKCIKCTLCEPVCFYDAISAPLKTTAVVYHEHCFQCGLCISVCPAGALSFQPRDDVTLMPG